MRRNGKIQSECPVESYEPPERKPATRCVKCGDVTCGGKPVCPQHVMDMPYAQQVASGFERLELETLGAAAPNLLLADIRSVLRYHGGSTPGGIARQLRGDVSKARVIECLSVLVASGEVYQEDRYYWLEMLYD